MALSNMCRPMGLAVAAALSSIGTSRVPASAQQALEQAAGERTSRQEHSLYATIKCASPTNTRFACKLSDLWPILALSRRIGPSHSPRFAALAKLSHGGHAAPTVATPTLDQPLNPPSRSWPVVMLHAWQIARGGGIDHGCRNDAGDGLRPRTGVASSGERGIEPDRCFATGGALACRTAADGRANACACSGTLFLRPAKMRKEPEVAEKLEDLGIPIKPARAPVPPTIPA